MIDLSTKFGQRAAKRLKEENVIWLTTVGQDLTPHPRPVWFLWDGEWFLIFSQPDTYKLRHISRHPRVSLNFNSDRHGDDIIVFEGEAKILEEAPPLDEMNAYLEKYTDGIRDLQSTTEEFVKEYRVGIRVRPDKVRGF